MDLEERKLKEYDYWDLYVDQYQCYLGKSFAWLKREGVTDLMDITEEERNELFAIVKDMRNVLRELFGADHFNYAVQGNHEPHCHMHIVPRYKTSVAFDEVAFDDLNWGRNYSPYNKEFKIADSVLKNIHKSIQENI